MSKVKIALIILLCYCMLPISLADAQSPSPEIVIPVQGKWVYENSTPAMQLDTYTGNISELVDPQGLMGSFDWSSDGTQLTYTSFFPVIPILNIMTGDIYQFEYNVDADKHIASAGWAHDDRDILYDYVEYHAGQGDYSLNLFDIATESLTTILSHTSGDLLVDFPLPSDVEQFLFTGYQQVSRNPVFDTWVFIKFDGYPPGTYDEGGMPNFSVNVLWNYETGQTVSLDAFFNNETVASEPFIWSPDGQRFTFTTYNNRVTTHHMVKFDPINGEIESIDRMLGGSVILLDWTTAGNIMVALLQGDYTVIVFVEMQNGALYETTFIRDYPSGITSGDWFISASKEELAELSCLFDQTLPTQLVGVNSGRVSFTDGTPTRLRLAPDLYSDQVTLMPEGTEFDLLAGPTCKDGYRWWQLELRDGTVGWAAEASTDSYFLEPLPTIADAGPDQTLPDADSSGTESITLDGSASPL